MLPSHLSESEKLKIAKQLYEEARSADTENIREMMEDFDFRNGEQWKPSDVAILESELRAPLKWNLIHSTIESYMGICEETKKRYRATPVEPGDEFLAEILNDIERWVFDNSNLEAKEDEGVESAGTCGRGYLALDYNPDPKRFMQTGDIKITETPVSINQVGIDPNSREDDWSDASYITWDKWLHVEDFKVQYPEYADRIDDFIESGNRISLYDHRELPPEIVEESDTDTNDHDYRFPLSSFYYNKSSKQIRVVQLEYRKAYTRHWILDPEANEYKEFNEQEYKKIRKVYQQIYGIPFNEKVYTPIKDTKVCWLQFIGDKIIYDSEKDPNGFELPYDGFSICPVFGYKDTSRRTNNYFGIVRFMKDPQMEVNKRMSQAINLLNKQLQPGIIAETDAFMDNYQAEQALRTPGDIAWASKGAISQGRIKEIAAPRFPDAPVKIHQIAEVMMKKISGINADLLGLDSGRQEPGIVVQQRKQQGVMLLKRLLANGNNMRKAMFERRLAIITRYMPDSQIVRILGRAKNYRIQNGWVIDEKTGLTAHLRDLRSLEYNVDAEPMNASMSFRMFTLSTFMEMMQAGLYVPPELIIDNMDLPITEKNRWKEAIAQREKAAAEAQEKEMQQALQLEMLKIQTENKDIDADTAIKMAKIRAEAVKQKNKREIDMERIDVEQDRVDKDFVVRVGQNKIMAKQGANAK